ncbi:MAG: DUF1878 family protein [Bacillus sp. (in: firmicutes)]
MEDVRKRVEQLEFQQSLLLRMLKNSKEQLYYMIIQKNLTKQQTEELLILCENMSKKYEKQKAEGYVTFYPLLSELKKHLPANISPEELVSACLRQGEFLAFMEQMGEELKR